MTAIGTLRSTSKDTLREVLDAIANRRRGRRPFQCLGPRLVEGGNRSRS
jgi:hypothetical protein